MNAFFVACEFSVVKVRISSPSTRWEEGNMRAAFVKQVRENLNAYLSATSSGRNAGEPRARLDWEQSLARMLQPFLAVCARSNLTAVSTSISFALAFAAITFLHIVVGELAPKILAIRKSMPAAFVCDAPLRWFYAIV